MPSLTEMSPENSAQFGLQRPPALTVDVVIFSLALPEHGLNTLLVRRANDPFRGEWAIPGGFVNYNESLETAATRELAEETGVRNVYLEQLYSFGNPNRDPRGHTVTVTYFALIPADSVQVIAGTDAAEAAWHSVYKPPRWHSTMLGYCNMHCNACTTNLNIRQPGSNYCLQSSLSQIYRQPMRSSSARNWTNETSGAVCLTPT